MSTEKIAPPLTSQQFEELCNSYRRLQELKSRQTGIITPLTEPLKQEINTVRQHIATILLRHCGEFLNCWHCVRNEYEPLIGIISNRCTQNTIHALDQMARAKAQENAKAPDAVEPLEPEQAAPVEGVNPDNIIPLPTQP